jgi:hypothetical protein
MRDCSYRRRHNRVPNLRAGHIDSDRSFRRRREMRFVANENFPRAAVKLLQSAGCALIIRLKPGRAA